MGNEKRKTGHRLELLAIRRVVLERVHQVEEVRGEDGGGSHHADSVDVAEGRGGGAVFQEAGEDRDGGVIVSEGEESLRVAC